MRIDELDIAGLAERLSDILLLVADDGRVLDANAAALDAYGCSIEQVTRLGLKDLCGTASKPPAVRQLRDAAASGSRYAAAHRRADGTEFPVEVSWSPVTWDGETAHLGVVLDLTDHEAAGLRRARSAEMRLRLVDRAHECTLDELLEEMLDEAEKLTGSEIGYCHLVDADQENLELQTWSTLTRQRCTADGQGMRYPVAEAGVWADCLRKRSSVVHNDYASLPDRKGLPQGHVAVVRELAVPVVRGGLVVAVVGVGNKATDYDAQDVATIGQLADLTWDIAERKRADEALRQSEEKYRIVADNTFDWEFWTDREGRFVYCSPSCERVTDHAVSEFMADQALLGRMIHPEDRAAWAEHLKAYGGTDSGSTTFRIIRPDGTERWIEHLCQAVVGDGGEVLGRRGSNRDITQRKEAQGALQTSDRRYRLLFTGMLEGFAYCRMILDPEGRPVDWVYLDVNEAFVRITGLQGVVGKRVLEVLPAIATDSPELMEAYGRVAATGQPEEFEFDFKTLGMWLRISAFRPEPGHFVAVFEDITETKRAEAALRESERRYRSISEAVSSFVYSCVQAPGGTYRVDWMAGAVAEVTGYAPEEIIRRSCWNFMVLPEDTHLFESNVIGLEPGQTATAEFRIVAADGTVIWLRSTASAAPIDARTGSHSLVGSCEDITPRRQAEDSLLETNERLERILKSITTTMGKVVETRDPYTQGHEQGVAALGRLIAEEMGLPEDDTRAVETAALVHDIGKLSVPAEILTKPGKLSDTEFALIREHSKSGYEILREIDFGWPIADIVLQHHERMDGSGYPNGLSGGAISVAARIVAVADVVEAMASRRPYRPALGIEAAAAEIRECSEKYDPQVATAFLRLYEAGRIDL